MKPHDEAVEAFADAYFGPYWRNRSPTPEHLAQLLGCIRSGLAAYEAAMWRQPETAVLGETLLGAFVNDGTTTVGQVAWAGPLSTEWESRDPFSWGFGVRKPDAIRPIPLPPSTR